MKYWECFISCQSIPGCFDLFRCSNCWFNLGDMTVLREICIENDTCTSSNGSYQIHKYILDALLILLLEKISEMNVTLNATGCEESDNILEFSLIYLNFAVHHARCHAFKCHINSQTLMKANDVFQKSPQPNSIYKDQGGVIFSFICLFLFQYLCKFYTNSAHVLSG